MHWFKQPAQHIVTKYSSWWRRLDQEEYIRLSHTSSEDVLVKTNVFVLAIHLQDVFKTSSRRLAKTCSRHLPDVFKTSSRRLQEVLKMSSRRFKNLQEVLLWRLQDVLQKCLQGIFKTSWRGIQDLLERYLQNVFKTYHQVKLFLLTSLREVLQRRLSTEGFA